MGVSEPTNSEAKTKQFSNVSSMSDSITEAKLLLQKKQFSNALAITSNLLTRYPDNIEALYLTAVCQRYLQQPQQALATLNTLKSYHPNYARAYQEEGHNYRLSNSQAAISAYEKAVQLNAALIASWKNLNELYRAEGQIWSADHAQNQVDYWSGMPQALVSVSSLINEDNVVKAEEICRFFLKKQPKHTEAMRLLAAIGVKHKVLDDAEFLLESCLHFDPEFHQARLDYVNVLHKRQRYEKALEQALLLRSKSPNDVRYQMAVANESQAVGEFNQAIHIYREILNQLPDNSGVLIMLGHAYKTVGETDNAVAAYQKAGACQENFGDAFWSLANLKTYSFSADEITTMQAREQASDTPFEDRFHLSFALGKAFEDAGDYSQAFSYYAKGNALKKQQLGYQAARVDAECKAQIEVCTPALFSQHAPPSNTPNPPSIQTSQATPIFIVGLPRAGSTLLEQILSSHSMVDGTMELPNIMSLSHRLNGRGGIDKPKRYPQVLAELSAEQLGKFGEEFIRDTEVYRQGAPFFIDKMPNNFRHIGLIHLILPNAIIIDARRDPMSCGFSIFKQLFAEGQEFSYNLEDIGKYYNNYVELMAHWNTVLPGKILKMQYEDVVTDFEEQVRKLLDFCGLPFEESCLNFYKTKRSVRTASAEQVRQPIYQSGMQQWKHFESDLGPLSTLVSALT
ncbi:tetratricopeptide repeat-containing sulfotransferase family protein [Alteromonas stellipolaris]|uniref:tetratricopeptide repeat-containing sulfotransferase family protein n=1 Tax=Alteromonas stellipolaris TaxID=233316 RepID=UPI0027342FEC|nr:tetratricopeptide repeat-containing sulfotransferase family protein [Alteromonas stellipolaris]MDP2596662.1 sulfotransferase [Alteromonas stellipolaris]